jgi:hypothetical protein
MSEQDTRYRTQWSSQFYAAAELTRRGYLVSLTFGNAPVSDLLVQSPSGDHFTVDVKGQSTKNFWLIRPRTAKPDHYFILVFVPRDGSPPKFFIVRSDELMRHREKYKQSALISSGKYRDDLGGINWGTALAYEDKWDSLPE